jgi:hypothetical protein
MAQNKILNIEPVAISNSVANILNPGITSLSGPTGYTQTQPYLLIKHIRIVNKTGTAATVSLYKGASGASAAGTEYAFNGTSVPANSSVDWYGLLRLDSGDYLTGVAGTASALTFNAEGEIGLS